MGELEGGGREMGGSGGLGRGRGNRGIGGGRHGDEEEDGVGGEAEGGEAVGVGLMPEWSQTYYLSGRRVETNKP